MSDALEFVICRKCNHEYAKWAHAFCRFCWKKFFKKTGYIETKEEVEKYCTKI